MCAIAGIIDLQKNPVIEQTIRQLLKPALHRGPDGSGIFVHENLALGHNRLAIIDTSPEANQPMHWHDKYVLTFNGAIYNYVEIKSELENFGYTFTTKSDTEIILAAYDKWETACVEKFNGMWAFGLFDKTKNKLFCSRDRFGVKPFYYAVYQNKFLFASEIKQLLTVIKPEVNYKTVTEYIVYNLEDHGEETFFKNIYKLLPSHHLHFDLQSQKFSTEKYFVLKQDENIYDLSETEIETQFQQHATRAIQWRLRSEVKTGTCLSGGLDSSYIISQLKKIIPTDAAQFYCITAQSTQKENDESAFAKSLFAANEKQFSHQLITPSKENFLTSMDEVFRCQEEPFSSTSIFMQYFVMQAAQADGVKVLLDGQGADEILLGYDRYLPVFVNSFSFPKNIFAFFEAQQNAGIPLKELLAFQFYFTNADKRIARLKKKHQFIKKDFLQLADNSLLYNQAENFYDAENFPITEIFNTQLPQLLRYEDRNSMHFGIESRLPYLDKDWAVFNFSLPLEMKIKHGHTKNILRNQLRKENMGLIADRKRKIGFSSPEKNWLSDENYFLKTINDSPLLQKIYNNRIPQQLDRQMLWKLFSVAKWESLIAVPTK